MIRGATTFDPCGFPVAETGAAEPDADADAVFPIDNKNVRLGTQAHDRIYLVPLL